MGYINPISIIGGDHTSAPNTLKGWGNVNPIRVAYQAKEVNSDGGDYYAGPSASGLYVIYGNGLQIGMTGVDYPFVWTAPKSGGTAALIELINGLPNRPAGTQYTTIESAMNWLVGQSEAYFVISENYPWQRWTAPIVTIDAGVPQSSGFEHDLKAYDISGAQLTTYFTYGASSLAYADGPTGYWNITNLSQGMVSSSNAIAIPSGGFAISVWFYLDTPISPGSPKPLYSKGDYTSDGFALALTDTGINFGNGANLGSLTSTNVAAISTGAWHNIMITRNSTTGFYTMYLDGSQIVNNVTISAFTFGNGHSIYVGKTHDNADGPFGQKISMFSISAEEYSAGVDQYYTAWTNATYNGRYL